MHRAKQLLHFRFNQHYYRYIFIRNKNLDI